MRRLPVAAAAAILVAAASVGGITLYHSATAVRTSDSQAWSAASEPSRDGQPAQRSQQQQGAPDAATGAKSGSGAGSTPSAAGNSSPKGTPGATATPGTASASAAPAAKTLSYQFQWQENYYFCGPAATRIALSAQGAQQTQNRVAQSLRTTVNGTNSADDTTRALNELTNSSFYKSHFIRTQAASQADVDQLRADVVHAVSNGYAVVANIAGTATDNDGNAHSYPGGHFLTVVGYSDDGQNVTIADPADARGVGRYTMATTRLAHWVALRGYSA
ncbi:C39 family peptidase [Dactylosporangium sp. NPDC005572]|uniref:C39 family peptidase n=1 Tax=Dactylosporangium sp. NPDC005572 TaxID=3156889 RepID=UPI0033A06891